MTAFGARVRRELASQAKSRRRRREIETVEAQLAAARRAMHQRVGKRRKSQP